MFSVGRVTSQGLGDLFVDTDVDLHASLSGSFDGLVKSPFLVEERWTSQEEFGGQPPIFNVDCLLGFFNGD